MLKQESKAPQSLDTSVKRPQWHALASQTLKTLVTLLILGESAFAEPVTAPEYAVKAGFLVAFVQYTYWPANTSASNTDPINVCVIGDNPFGDVLARTAQEQKSRHPIKITLISDVTESQQCQVVFVGQGQTKKETAWLAALKNQSVLTVGESGHAIEHGAILEFVIANDRVRFEVNWAAMEAAGLKLGAPLLASARKVQRSAQVTP
jgi:co-chaperonin GroES (HSP10)